MGVLRIPSALFTTPLSAPSFGVLLRAALFERRPMPINYDELMQAKSEGITSSYGDRETMLYALGIGFMRDPMNADELPFAYENGLKTVPTMATVIGWASGDLVLRLPLNYMLVG